MLGYAQLRQSSLRCPGLRLAVTGSMREAFWSIPPPEYVSLSTIPLY